MSEEFEPQERRQIGAGNNQPGSLDQPGFPWDKAEATGRLLARAAAIFAYGGLDGVLNRPLLHEAGIYPHFATSAEGYRLVDGSGQTYLDWVNGWSSIILGHNHPTVREAMIEQAHRGSSVALMYPVEVEAGEAIVKMVPNAEMLAFGKNGSDSLTAAIRIARAATGREMVLQFGFHGFHDWYACLNEQAQGLLKTLRQYTVPFSYNDLAGLESLLHRFQGKVAAIVMEPVNFELPGEGYLQAVKDLAHRHGALLIWDEVVTAFRLSRGGAQAFYGVQPDLAVLGKAMANGMPLSAVVGPRDLMQKLKHTAYGMTFRGEAVSLAAARACLTLMQQQDVAGHLHRIGEELRGHFSKLAKAYGIHCELRGLSARMAFFFEAQGQMSGRQLRSVFILECLKRGILTNGNILPSFAHDQAAITSTTLVFEQALSRVRDAIDASQSSKPSKARYLHDASAVAVRGCIGMVDFSPQRLLLIGWCLVDDVVPDSLYILTENAKRVAGQVMLRTDLVDKFPAIENVQQAGFRFELSVDSAGNFPNRFQMVAIVNGLERFHCFVIIEPCDQPPTSFRKTGPFWLQSGVVIV